MFRSVRAASRILDQGGRNEQIKMQEGRSHQNYSSTNESARSWGGGGAITPLNAALDLQQKIPLSRKCTIYYILNASCFIAVLANGQWLVLILLFLLLSLFFACQTTPFEGRLCDNYSLNRDKVTAIIDLCCGIWLLCRPNILKMLGLEAYLIILIFVCRVKPLECGFQPG